MQAFLKGTLGKEKKLGKDIFFFFFSKSLTSKFMAKIQITDNGTFTHFKSEIHSEHVTFSCVNCMIHKCSFIVRNAEY